MTLQFARRFNFTGSSKILELDQARAKALKARALAQPGHFSRAAITNVPATNQAVEYTATVRSLRFRHRLSAMADWIAFVGRRWNSPERLYASFFAYQHMRSMPISPQSHCSLTLEALTPGLELQSPSKRRARL